MTEMTEDEQRNMFFGLGGGCERLLDEVTLICVRDGIERLPREEALEQRWGYLARDIADKICWGIDEFDAE